MPEPRDIELRSESVQEILGRIPPWIIRYGIGLIFGLVLLLVLLAWLIRYPDVIAGTGVLTSLDPPRAVVARSDGRLVVLSATDGGSVSRNAPLAVIESSADPNAMDSLRKMLPVLSGVLGTSDSLIPHLGDLDIGEGRPMLAELRSVLEELRAWRTERYRAERNEALSTKIKLFRTMIRASEEQLTWASRKQQNYVAEARIDTVLAGKGVLSATEFRSKQNTFIDQEMNVSGMERSLQQSRISLLELEAQFSDLVHADEVHERELEQRFRARMDGLLRFLGSWQLDHTLNAPVGGLVHYGERLDLDQPIHQGDTLFHVVPPVSTYVVEARIPSDGAGKVKVGQAAYVQLNGYPASEYGQLVGRVRSIATMGRGNNYRLVIELPQGLCTSFHRSVPYSPEMQGRVEVVARDRSVFGRIVDRLRGALD